jgi:hypothetical protein
MMIELENAALNSQQPGRRTTRMVNGTAGPTASNLKNYFHLDHDSDGRDSTPA